MEKPTTNYLLAYEEFRAELSDKIASLQKKLPLPTNMIEGILASLLADIRSALIAEVGMEHKIYQDKLSQYYEEREQKLNDEILQLKAKDEATP